MKMSFFRKITGGVLILSVVLILFGLSSHLSIQSAEKEEELNIQLNTETHALEIALSDSFQQRLKNNNTPYRLYYFHQNQESTELVQGTMKEGIAEASLKTCSGEDCVEHEITRAVLKLKFELVPPSIPQSMEPTRVDSYYLSIQDDELSITSKHKGTFLELSDEDSLWLENGTVNTPTLLPSLVPTNSLISEDVLGDVIHASDTDFELEDTIADVVIGQPNMYSNLANNPGFSDKLFNNSHSIATDGTRLFVVEYHNNRVLIYNSIPTSNYAPADVVIGQPDMNTNIPNNGGISAKSLDGPVGVDTDGTRLYITDYRNNRVLIYNSIPTSNFQPADVVLGQPDFSSSGANQGGTTPTEYTVYNPYYIASNGTNLAIADSGNHRVLFYNSIPTTNGTAADLVLGQPDFVSNTANNGGRTAQSLYQPLGVDLHGYQLFITDYRNHRVLIHTTLPIASHEAADIVVGQTSMTGGGAATAANRLYFPLQSTTDGTRLYIADRSSNRILIYNTIPTTNAASADVVLGQQNMTSRVVNDGGVSSQSLNAPTYAISDGSRLFISDYNNRRVLIHNSIPTIDFAPADIVLGKESLTSSLQPNAGTLYRPYHAVEYDGRIFIADQFNNRVLMYNSVPEANGSQADLVIGQPDFEMNTPSVTDKTFNEPYDTLYAESKLFIADEQNGRILVFDGIPTSNFPTASFTIGKATFTSDDCTVTDITKRMCNTKHLSYYQGKLIVADGLGTNRVMIYNSIPTASNAGPDIVVGQPDKTTVGCNSNGLSDASICTPNGTTVIEGHLVVADRDNNRVLIYDSLPNSDGAAASIVIGQPDFITRVCNYGGSVSRRSLCEPLDVATDGKQLYVLDGDNNRILVYNTLPTTNYTDADQVIGQPDFTSNASNNGGLSASTLASPYGISISNNKLMVADRDNNRVLIYNGIPSPTPTNLPGPSATPQPQATATPSPISASPTPATVVYPSSPPENDGDNNDDKEEPSPSVSPTPTSAATNRDLNKQQLSNAGTPLITTLLILFDVAMVSLILFLIHRNKKSGKPQKEYTFLDRWVRGLWRKQETKNLK